MQVDYPTTQLPSTAIWTAQNSQAIGSTAPYCLINRISHIPPGKELTRNLTPLRGKTDSYIKISAHFVEQIKEIVPQDFDVIVSFDVKSLFTTVPIDEALQVESSQLA